MNYMDIKTLDIANGPGCRVSLFVAGCPHHCKGCFNPESWPYDAGKKFTETEANRIIELLKNDYYEGFSILGGEPMCPENVCTVSGLIKRIRNELNKRIPIWIYTGYTIEYLLDSHNNYEWVFNAIIKTLSNTDVLVDGPFIEELKDLKLQYCGSTNQRVIDLDQYIRGLQNFQYDKYNFNNDKYLLERKCKNV